jgi:hypothetical protein
VLAGYPNGLNPQAAESMSPELLAAVRQQMCNMVDAANFVAGFNLPPNMTVQSMTPNLSGNPNANIQNPKIGSPVALQQINKNGGESSNMMQMSRLGSPALHILPPELTVHGLQNLSPSDIEDIEFRKKEKRLRKSLDDDFDEHHKALNNSQVSITKTNSPRSNKTLSMESLEPVVNMTMGSQTIDMSFKSSRNSTEGSINGEDSQRSFRHPSLSGFDNSSPIKLEPLADCRE